MALTIGDNFNYQGAKPLDARLMYATLAEMAAKADSTLYNGILAYCVATDKTYQWKSTNTVDPDTGKWREFTSGGIQVSTMPSAGADEVGHIYEYIGNTSASFINGRFYKCVTDGTTYEWAEVLMNDKFPSGGDAGQSLVKNSSTDDDVKWGNPEKGRAKSSAIAPVFDDTETYAEGDRVTYEDELYVFNKAHTGAWAAADADKSDVDSEIPDKLTSQQMQEIKDAFVINSPRNGYPVLFDETGAEHFVGWYKYANSTKKPVYEKTINCGIGPNKTEKTVAHGINNLDNVIKIEGIGKAGNNNYISIPSTTDRIFADSSAQSGYLLYQLQVQVSTSNIVLMARDSNCSSNTNIYVTIQYTKTTDTPQ